MSWVETESNRANRNLLIFNSIVALGSGAAVVSIVTSTVRGWQDQGMDGAWIPGLLFLAIFALSAWYCTKAFQRYRDIEKTPIWRYLAPYGEPRQLGSEIEQDLLAPAEIYNGLKITPNWLIHKHLFSSSVTPIADIAWVYELVTRHRTNGIPTGKSYSAVVLGRHKQKLTVRASRQKVDDLLAGLRQRAPWAVFGYSAELQTAWTKNHAAFVAAVDDRKKHPVSK